MKVLVSARCLDEARLLVALGADIVDVKNPAEGSLGAALPRVVRDIAQYATGRGVATSATLGDLPFKPGTAALAAFGLAQLGVRYVKVGLFGARTRGQATELLQAVIDAVAMVDESIMTVATGYADYRSFDGLTPHSLLHAAGATQCAVAMLDTATKEHGSLLDVMAEGDLRSFVASAHGSGLAVALAGSIGIRHLPVLESLQPEIIGVRGALCIRREREQQIDGQRASEFLKAAQLSSSSLGGR